MAFNFEPKKAKKEPPTFMGGHTADAGEAGKKANPFAKKTAVDPTDEPENSDASMVKAGTFACPKCGANIELYAENEDDETNGGM